MYLHRRVMNAPAGMLVDHINGNGLDNRRGNLRLATPSQNVCNRVTTSASGYRGVEAIPDRSKPWRACLYKGKKRTEVGTFDTAEEAARAYDAAAAARYGAFAKLNFPEPDNDADPQASEAA